MKTKILVLKHQLTVKYLIVWPRGQLLVEKKTKQNKTTKTNKQTNKPTLLGAPGKRSRKATPTPSEITTFWIPHPPLRISVALRGEGMDIFWNYMYYSRGKYG